MIDDLLFMYGSLFPNESWANIRKKALESSPNTELGSVDYISNEVCREIFIIMNLLSPAKVKQYFKIDKKCDLIFAQIVITKQTTMLVILITNLPD
ncbi:hypothetical protein ACSZN8_01140 [Aeromonas caviae]|uniref:hypothetical protein n=1 Tax=Aeromonas caviae TaxID=648 RepID=UPI003EC5655C